MTPEAQRIAIAAVCGWKRATQTIWVCSGENPAIGDDNLPDYLTDLNAMHAAEKTIKAPHLYNKQLEMVVLGYVLDHKDAVAEFMLRNATAAQRAEAFLRTLNLWTP